MKVALYAAILGVLAKAATVAAAEAEVRPLPPLPVFASYAGFVSSVPNAGASIGLVYGRNPTLRIASDAASERDRELTREISRLVALLPARLRPIEPPPWEVGFGSLNGDRLLQREVAKLLRHTEFGEVQALSQSRQASNDQVDAAVDVLRKFNPSLGGVPTEKLRRTVVDVQAYFAFEIARVSAPELRGAIAGQLFSADAQPLTIGDTYLLPESAKGVCLKHQRAFEFVRDNLNSSPAFKRYVVWGARLFGLRDEDPTAVSRLTQQWQDECVAYEALAAANHVRKKLADAADSAVLNGATAAFEKDLVSANLPKPDIDAYRKLLVTLGAVKRRSEDQVSSSRAAFDPVHWTKRAERPRLRFDGKVFRLIERSPDYLDQTRSSPHLTEARLEGRPTKEMSISDSLSVELSLIDHLFELEVHQMLDGIDPWLRSAHIGYADALLHERREQAREVVYAEAVRRLAELRALREETLLRDGNGAFEPDILGIVASTLKNRGDRVSPGAAVLTYSPSMGREFSMSIGQRLQVGSSRRCVVVGNGSIPIPSSVGKELKNARSSVESLLKRAFQKMTRDRVFQCTVLSVRRRMLGYEMTGVIEDTNGYALDIGDLVDNADAASAIEALVGLGLAIRDGTIRLLLLAGSLPNDGSVSLEFK